MRSGQKPANNLLTFPVRPAWENEMLKSMTGFAAADKQSAFGSVLITARAVNSKSCDVSLRLPQFLFEFETEFINLIKNRCKRGKLYVVFDIEKNSDVKINFNDEIILQYVNHINELKNKLNDGSNSIDYYSLLRLPECIQIKSAALDSGTLKDTVETLLIEVIDKLEIMRKKEGANLTAVIHKHLDSIRENLDIIKSRLSESVKKYREKLTANVAEVMRSYEKSDDFERRLIMEISFYTEKIDVSEEIDRLTSHLKEFEKILETDDDSEPAGRTLEFLLQEMNREINTCGVKSPDSQISHSAVAIKNLLDKIKEQVMNIC